MKPYYEEDGITIYHGDCREILPSLGRPAELVMTDPPYAIGLDYGHVDTWRPGTETWELIRRSMKPDASLHFTSSNRHLPYWLATLDLAGFEYMHCSVFWNRTRAGGNGNGQFAYAWEPLLHFKPRGSSFRLINRMLSDVFAHTGGRDTDHPAERHLGTWTAIMDLLPGITVLDPFMGSGTTLRAAKNLGRQAVGIELEERFCEMAANRLGQGVLAL